MKKLILAHAGSKKNNGRGTLNGKFKKKYSVIKLILAHAGLEPATFALLARRSNQLS